MARFIPDEARALMSGGGKPKPFQPMKANHQGSKMRAADFRILRRGGRGGYNGARGIGRGIAHAAAGSAAFPGSIRHRIIQMQCSAASHA